MSDLMEKISWLNKNDEYAKKVGEAGRALAHSITYDREMAASANVISQCFRYFNGEKSNINPFGRAD